MGASRTLRQFPFVAEQVREEVVAPLRGGGCPNDFQAAADRVSTTTFAKFVLPSETLLLDGSTFWLVTYILSGNGSTVRFAEGVSAGNEGNGFFVVHRHAGKRFPDIACRGDRIRLSIGPFRIHVNQTHLHRAERILEVAIAGVTLVRQPRSLRSPINVLFRLPYVRAPAAKTECLEAHRLQCDVACQNHEVGPRDFPAILLLDRPQQPASLVQVHVIRPAIEWCEALLTGSRPAAAVADAVSAGTVPRHTNEQRSVVAKVGRPPF